MSRRRRVMTVVALTAVLVVSVPAVAGDQKEPTEQQRDDDETLVPTAPYNTGLGTNQVIHDDVQITVRIDESGRAIWIVDYRVVLNNSAREQAFSDIESDIEDDEKRVASSFSESMESAAETASETTGREMAIESVSVSTERQPVPEEIGIIRYRFTWTNFAATRDDSVVAGDAIEGFVLSADTVLALGWSGSLARGETTPEPDETRPKAVVWRGDETTFVSGEPRIRIESTDEATEDPPRTTTREPTDVATEQPTERETEQPPERETTDTVENDAGGITTGPTTAVLASVVILLLVGVTGGLLWRRQTGISGGPAATGATEEQPPLDDELLGPDARVTRLLEHNDGRMKQAAIADELDWTDAKTSRVVSSLKEDGEVEVYRLGRENVVQLPDASDGL